MATFLFVVTLCSLIYAIPSYILYIIILHIILTRKKQFSSHFYRFYVVQGIVELVEYPGDLFGRRSLSIPELYDFFDSFMPQSGIVVTIIYWFITYVFAVRSIIPLYMALYRLTAVALPTKCESLWNRIYNYCIYGAFLVALLVTSTMLLGSTVEKSINSSGQRVMTFLNNHKISWYRVSTGLCSIMVISIVTSQISYALTLWILKCKKNSVRNKHVNVTQELRLTVFMVLLWSTQVYTLSTQVLYFFRDVKNPLQHIYITELNYYGLELSIFLNPWFMLFCNKSLRTEVLRKYFSYLCKVGVNLNSSKVNNVTTIQSGNRVSSYTHNN